MSIFEYTTIALTVLGMAIALFRWVAHVDQNTEATKRLSRAFEMFTERIDSRLTDHETRISRLEGREERRD